MTLSIAWLRTVTSRVHELVFCSDSRLSGGNRFDHAAKLFSLPRSDCALAFAGSTYWAYPMATALARATQIHEPSATRAMELPKYLTHLTKILTQLQAAVHSYANGENIPDVTFLFGGWDWIQKKHRLWKIVFDPREMRFVTHERTSSNGFGGLGLIEFAGDKPFVQSARTKLKTLVQSRHGLAMKEGSFDFEPFEVLREILGDVAQQDTVGGAPQLIKVYQHMNVRHYGIPWPGSRDPVHYAGRPLLPYERVDNLWILDPETLRSSRCERQAIEDADCAELAELAEEPGGGGAAT